MVSCSFFEWFQQENSNSNLENRQLIRDKNSWRVLGLSLDSIIFKIKWGFNQQLIIVNILKPTRNSPIIELVVVMEFSFSTPLITMHIWVASTTTPTPRALTASFTAFAICLVSLSWTSLNISIKKILIRSQSLYRSNSWFFKILIEGSIFSWF